MSLPMKTSVVLWTAFILAFVVPTLTQANDKPFDLIEGDPAPTLRFFDEQNQIWTSTDKMRMRFVVVFFYPGDFEPKSVAQFRRYRDLMPKFVDRGAVVIGVSGDAEENHSKFKATYDLNFPLVSDEDGSISKQFGVPSRLGGKVRQRCKNGGPFLNPSTYRSVILTRGSTAVRRTFVLGRNGTIIYKNSKVDPLSDGHVALTIVEQQMP